MKLQRQQLINILKQTAPAITEKGSLPTLSNICFRNGKAMATNLRLTIIAPFDGIEGVLPHKLLLSVLSASNETEIELTQKSNSWELKSGKSVHKLGKSDTIEHFPLEPAFEADNTIAISDEQVMHIKNAVKFQGPETSGAEGILIAKDIVGTNGLVVYKSALIADCKLHIPADFVSLISDIGGELNYNDKFVSFESNGVKIITSQLEAKYPGYEVVFKDEYNWNIALNRQSLLNEIKSVLAYTPPVPVISFEFNKDKCSIEYIYADLGHEYKGQMKCTQSYNNTVKLHAIQLQAILNCFSDEEIEMSISAPNKSVYIREKGNLNTITLIQPNA